MCWIYIWELVDLFTYARTHKIVKRRWWMFVAQINLSTVTNLMKKDRDRNRAKEVEKKNDHSTPKEENSKHAETEVEIACASKHLRDRRVLRRRRTRARMHSLTHTYSHSNKLSWFICMNHTEWRAQAKEKTNYRKLHERHKHTLLYSKQSQLITNLNIANP